MVQFSIIIPLYNKESAIRETLDSILNQSYGNYEILVIDDGSRDKSAEIVNSIQDGRIRYIKKENGGVSSARNFGICHATNPWLLFLDADDLMEGDALETFVKLMRLRPGYKIYQGNMWLSQCLRCKTVDKFVNISENPFKDWWKMILAPEMGTFVMHESLVSQVGLFNEKLSCFEDLEYTSRLMEHETFVYTSKPVKVYREEYCVLSVVPQPIEKEFAYHMTKESVRGSFWKEMVLAFNVWDTRRHRKMHGDNEGVEYYTRQLSRLFPWYINLYFKYKDCRQALGEWRRHQNKNG